MALPEIRTLSSQSSNFPHYHSVSAFLHTLLSAGRDWILAQHITLLHSDESSEIVEKNTTAEYIELSGSNVRKGTWVN